MMSKRKTKINLNKNISAPLALLLVQFFEREKPMKKFCYLITIFIVLTMLCIPACAYNFNGDSLFTIEIPESFVQTEYSDTSFSFENSDGDRFDISFKENDEGFCVKGMSEKDLKAYKENFAKDVETVMDAYELEIESNFISCEKVKTDDGAAALVSVIKTTIKKGERSETYYQKIYEFGGVNNKYTFSLSTTDEKRLDSFNDGFSSIVLNEATLRSTGENIAVYAFVSLIILLIVAGIVRFIRTPEKRRQGKL